jgi:hypothetical protein
MPSQQFKNILNNTLVCKKIALTTLLLSAVEISTTFKASSSPAKSKASSLSREPKKITAYLMKLITAK